MCVVYFKNDLISVEDRMNTEKTENNKSVCRLKKSLKKHRKGIVAGCAVIVIAVVFTFGRGNSTGNYTEETAQLRDIHTYKSFVGNVEPSSETSIISKVSQQVTELYVKEGDTVHKGDMIAQIDTTSVEQNITKTEISLTTTRTSNSYNISDAKRNYSNYKEALDEGLNSSLVSAQNTVDNAYTALQDAKEDYDTTVWRMDNGVYTGTQSQYIARENAQAVYDTAQEKVTKLQAAYDAAQAVYSVSGNAAAAEESFRQAETALAAGKEELSAAGKALDSAEADLAWAKQNVIESKQSVIDNAQASYETALNNYDVAKLTTQQQLDNYKAALDKTQATASTAATEQELQVLEDSLDDYTIYAPCDGTITELNISENSMVSTGSAIATISTLNTMTIHINVDEYSVLDTGEGSAVTILVDSIGKTYEGTLTRVSDVADLNNGVAYFEATVDFIPDEYVKSGMSVEVRLTNNDKKGVLTVSADALHYNDDNTAYVLVKSGSKQEVREVETGVTDGTYVEIVSGLKDGDIILTALSSNMPMPQGAPADRGN